MLTKMSRPPREHPPLEPRDSPELARLPRQLEQKHQQVAAQLRLPASHTERQEARLPRDVRDISDFGVLARLLPRLLPDVPAGRFHPDGGQELPAVPAAVLPDTGRPLRDKVESLLRCGRVRRDAAGVQLCHGAVCDSRLE